MVTLRQFKVLAESYGADLHRWPAELRKEAEALLAVSPDARAALAAERVLDEAIDAARAQQDAALWPPGMEDAALARLRSSVAARIAASPARHRAAPGRGARVLSGSWALSLLLGPAGLAAGGGVAVAAGLLLGALYTPVPAASNVLVMLQPMPLSILSHGTSQDD